MILKDRYDVIILSDMTFRCPSHTPSHSFTTKNEKGNISINVYRLKF